MHNAIYSISKHIYFIHALIMFIFKQFIEEIKYTRILIGKISWPTSYIAATFQTTIG